MKKCIECGIEINNMGWHGRNKFCSKKCSFINWYRNNRDWIKKYNRLNRDKKNKARRLKYSTNEIYRKNIIKQAIEYTKKYPERRKFSRLNIKYGISKEKYMELMNQQENGCAICGTKGNGNYKIFPHIDHNHETGITRGILCMNCNQGIGKFKDNISLLKKSIIYLEKYQNE